MQTVLMLICVVGFGVNAGQVASSQVPAWVGTWQLSNAKSSPGAPKQSVVTIDAVGKGIRVSTKTVNPAGIQSETSYTANFDGIEVPVTGAPTGATAALSPVDDRVFEVVTRAQGATTYSRHEVSMDRKTRTVTQKLVIGSREMAMTLVYERQ